MDKSIERSSKKDDKSHDNILKKNSTSYPIKVNTKLKALYDEYLKYSKSDSVDQESLIAKGLKYYQYLVRGIMTNPEYGIGQKDNSRGLLIYHSMGVGKTFLAVSTAIGLMDKYKPVVILAKSLQKNFSGTIEKYVKILHPNLSGEELTKLQVDIVNKFNFVSLDAYNMHDQVSKVAVNDLSNKLLIVDEAHNLFRGIINSNTDSTNARKLYNMVMATKNMRILFLTGTPAAKSPFELVACFNMLMGYEILPAQYEIFHRSYVYDNMGDIANMGYIKNKDKLSNRLVGMVSFVPTGESNSDKSDEFPEEYPTIIENIEMSADQYRQYLLAREKESDEKGSNFKGLNRVVKSKPMSLPSASSEKGSTYFVKSRTISNFTKAYDNAFDINDMNNYNCNNSEKMCRIVENIKKSPGIAIVYSQFVNAGGLKTFAKYLEKAGYSEYTSVPRTGGAEPLSYNSYIANGTIGRHFKRKVIPDNKIPMDSVVNFHMYYTIMSVASNKKIKYISFQTPELWNKNIEEYVINSTVDYKKHTILKISDILQTKPFSDKDKILYLSTPEIDPNAPNWYNFASKNIPERIDLSKKCVFGFDINEEKILHISNVEDIDKFEKEYVMCPDDISVEDRILCDYYGFVNWKKVSETYHGLIINPYIVKDIKFRIWYDSFDVNTAMIWNNDAIKNVYILYTPLYGINTTIMSSHDILSIKKGGDEFGSTTSEIVNDVKLKYAIISGEVDTVDRENIQKVLNSPGNINGELISVLLISKTGAEGLDLKGVRQVHLIEPYWDKAREDQVKSRGIRLGSHSHLPPDQRNVQPYLYISVANKQVFDGMVTRADKVALIENTDESSVGPVRRGEIKLIETETIDEQFHRKAVINYKINMAFRTLLQEVSIECAFNDYKNCKVCMPDDKPLYTNSFIQDLHLPDPCKNVEEQEVDVNELVFNNKPYYYQKNAESFTGYEFFEHNDKIDAYTPISKSTPLFLELSEYLINMNTQKSLNTIVKIIGGAEYTIFVSEPWFGYIKSGKKTVEVRRNKGDFKKMQSGDIVKWICKDDSVLTKIIKTQTYDTFKKYLEAEGLNKCLPGVETIEAGVAIYHKYYTSDDNVLAIEIEKI
jgi:ASC-1-like (ASCH) protein